MFHKGRQTVHFATVSNLVTDALRLFGGSLSKARENRDVNLTPSPLIKMSCFTLHQFMSILCMVIRIRDYVLRICNVVPA